MLIVAISLALVIFCCFLFIKFLCKCGKQYSGLPVYRAYLKRSGGPDDGWDVVINDRIKLWTDSLLFAAHDVSQEIENVDGTSPGGYHLIITTSTDK